MLRSGISGNITEVNEAEKLHLAGINLLERLNLDNVLLKAEGNGRFTYLAWTQPKSGTNGQVKMAKKGRIKVPA
jgi:hypothetical protein